MGKRQKATIAIIKRTAIDATGRLGSAYNACYDRIVGDVDTAIGDPLEDLLQISQCTLVKGNHNQTPLELIDIDEELRLSLLLDLTPKTGVVAIADHPHLINEYTRIFRYSYVNREEHFPDEMLRIRELLPSHMPATDTTHIIIGIRWGIDISIVLQLPSDDHTATMIDLTLEKYRTYLNGDSNDFKRTREDINAMKRILDTKVYSNIPTLNGTTVLHDLFHTISRLKTDDPNHHPLTYTLCPIQLIYHHTSSSRYLYRPLDSTNNNRLTECLVELSIAMRVLETCFNEDMQNLLHGHFKERLSNAKRQWSIVKEEYPQLIDHYAQLIFDIRSGQVRTSAIEKKFRNKTQIEMKNRINRLAKDVTNLNVKGHFINDLTSQEISYCDVTERNVTRNDDDTSLKHKLIIDENRDRILCSHDVLNKNNPALSVDLRRTLLDELARNSQLRLIYADFSYCDYPLHHMIILPSNQKQNKTKPKEKEVSATTTTSTTVPSPTSDPLTIKTMNVLLLGETDGGKSAFINAFINYLTFRTLEEAQSNKSLVVISDSLPMSDRDSLAKHTPKIGDINHSKSENFDHPDQSATRHCRSYKYNLNEKIKLRMIDTPGFGNTQDVSQDNQNLQHIFQYIQNFNHLHAVCFLLKSNESSLNTFLRLCLTGLFNHFGPNIRDNIIFCFTNSPSTLPTPGSTAPLLKDLLASLSVRKIPFRRKNTFCFDSDSFRYLFADPNKQEHVLNWRNSVIESHRLIRFIHKTLRAYSIPNESEVLRQIKIKIVHLTHPLVESMRSTVRNIIINKMHSLKQSIEALPDDNDHYRHLPHQPILLDYLQEYKITDDSLAQKQDDMIDHLSLFCHLSAELGYFLVHTAGYRNGDPFLTGLLRLIREEINICKKENRTYMNFQLVDSLKKLVSNYEHRIQGIRSNPKQSTLTDIQQWIEYINQHPLISGYVIDSTRTNLADGNTSLLV